MRPGWVRNISPLTRFKLHLIGDGRYALLDLVRGQFVGDELGPAIFPAKVVAQCYAEDVEMKNFAPKKGDAYPKFNKEGKPE